MKLSHFIVATSIVVGALFLGGSWFAVGHTFESVFRQRAQEQADEVARITFTSMYEIMSLGWTREQAERFLDALHHGGAADQMAVQLYRAPRVIARYGDIDQPDADDTLRGVIEHGQPADEVIDGQFRTIHPLKAEARCLACHDNAAAGDVLGAIEIRQPYERLIRHTRLAFYSAALPSVLLGMLLIGAAIAWVSRRVGRSVGEVEQRLNAIGRFSDLRHLELPPHQRDFNEIERIQQAILSLAVRLRSIAVDKNILMFEIGLLEKFVITSDVVRDWREYVSQLLSDINSILPAHVLFSVFQVDDELFEIEIFWHRMPDADSRAYLEAEVTAALGRDQRFCAPTSLNVHHHHPLGPQTPVRLDQDALALQVKSFFVDNPRIGSIVGIGVHSDTLREPTHNLVLDSILSTLLNVVGSIKAIHKYTRDLEYYATRDPLTDLYNQRVFWEFLDYEIARDRRHDAKTTLLMVDLDNFKLVNDHFGHAVGDRFLQAFARAAQNAVRSGDVLARYGGDEFVVLLPETDLAESARIAQDILAAASQVSIEVGALGSATASVSIGMAVYPDHADNAKDFFLFADTLMYRAKADGKQRVAQPSEEDVVEVFRNISDMGFAVLHATNERRIIPYFQPIVSAQTQHPEAVEVLSRMEVGGTLMQAHQFIEIAEKTGIIHRLDAIVIEAALEKAAASDFAGDLFFNLSPRALVLADFTRTLRSIVRNSRISPERIVFELTERDTVKNLSALERFFASLKTEGFRLAIDDFGSGFSSFHYLRQFPFDYLKIEGDFIANMIDNPRDRILVRSINDLARALDIRVIAEFVESAEVLDLVRELGIDYAQGYHVGAPSRELPGKLG